MVIAGLVVAITGDNDVDAVWFGVFAVGAIVAVGAAVVLWGKAARR